MLFFSLPDELELSDYTGVEADSSRRKFMHSQ
jgi:hypothetical protein